MESKVKLSVGLNIIATLFLIVGVFSVMNIVSKLAAGRVHFGLNVACLFIGVGLFMRRDIWRVCAVVYLSIGAILCPIILILASFWISQHPGAKFRGISGGPVTLVDIVLMILFLLAWIAFTYYSIRFLIRPDVRLLFEKAKPNDDVLPTGEGSKIE